MNWRLIISPPLDGATNMAIDHALARMVAAGDSPPTLRLYRWQPACVSLGYFQPSSAVNQSACAHYGYDIVRRPTGGRAILHADELTYALTVASTQPGFGGRILSTYRQISLALLAGLHNLNVTAAWSAGHAATSASAACFDTPADYEITVRGRKLIGSAQTRMRGAILQHGSLLLSADVARLYAVLNLDAAISSTSLAERMIALDEAAEQHIDFDTCASALVAGFCTTWHIRFTPGELTSAEATLAQTLRTERYANHAWTQRR